MSFLTHHSRGPAFRAAGVWGLTLGLAVVTLLGCQAAPKGQLVAPAVAGSDADAQLQFWHGLSEHPIASNDEAFHGLLLYLDGKSDATDYAGRVAALQSKGLLGEGFAQPADAPIRRGTLAAIVARLTQLRGGVNLTIFGPGFAYGRYALRETEYQGLFPDQSSPNQTFSGLEFVGIIGRLEDFQRYHPVKSVDTPASPAATAPAQENAPATAPAP